MDYPAKALLQCEHHGESNAGEGIRFANGSCTRITQIGERQWFGVHLLARWYGRMRRLCLAQNRKV